MSDLPESFVASPANREVPALRQVLANQPLLCKVRQPNTTRDLGDGLNSFFYPTTVYGF